MFVVLSRIFILSFGLSIAAPAVAADALPSPESLAISNALPERLEAALVLLDAQRADVPRFAFERQTYKKGAKTEIKQFDPSRAQAERWSVSFPSIDDNPKKHAKLTKKYAGWDGNSDKALMIPDLRKRMAGGARFLREAENAEIFEFDIADDYFLEGGGRKAEISKHIKGEIAIDIYSKTIRWIRYYAPEHFRPISIVKLKFYEIIQYVAPAWAGGPLVRVYETSKVQGSAPFTRINVDEIMVNDNIVPAG
ncbi:MAG: hypothetical protein COA47_01640 [Robiginitomaculum sp.]|nr:MAG: hypothetical protein COA47_01640 [Robiginitomaculum sp.]